MSESKRVLELLREKDGQEELKNRVLYKTEFFFERSTWRTFPEDFFRHCDIDARTTTVRSLSEVYREEGLVISCLGISIVNVASHPHIILVRPSDYSQEREEFCRLSGYDEEYLGLRTKKGEDERKQLFQHLKKILSNGKESDSAPCHVGDLISVFWRPNFSCSQK